MSKKRREDERGFALLLVFAMAAAIAVMLYAELPRAAFESQRAKEEVLMSRGQEYVRGIQLYIISFKKYPQTLDDLEKNPRCRMLRRRYKDPMTGEDEWRLIHATNGVVTDSKIKKNDKEKKAENTFITEGPAVGSTGPQSGNTGANLATRRRQSDSNQPGLPGAETGNPQANPVDPNAPPVQPGQPGQPGVPGQQPGVQGQIPGQPGAPQQFSPANTLGQRIGFPGAPGQQPGAPGQQQQGSGGITAGPSIGSLPPAPGASPSQTPQPGAYPQAGGYPNQPGVQDGRQPGFQQNPVFGQQQQGSGQQNQALNLIQGILTRPNPNMNPAAQAPQQAGGVMGTGIVGVASKYEGDSIKIYNERQKYDEWEFVYDPQKDPRNKTQGPGGTNQPNSPPTGGPLPNAMPQNPQNNSLTSGFGRQP